MKKILILFMLIATAIGVRAQSSKPTLPHDIVGGIFYIFDDSSNTATVGDIVDWSTPQFSNFYEGDIVIPSTVTYNGKTYTVTEIAAYAFSDYNEDLTSVVIPNTVTKIDSYAFDGT